MPARAALVAAVLVASVTATKTRITTDRAYAVDKTFDYVIAGGGLTGITVANKLSAAGNTVLIIEAGIDAKDVPAVYDAERRGQLNGTCNWQYQSYGDNGKPLSWKIDSGKCLGGSSSINGMVWYRPTKMEMDALETFGNPGWNWASLEPHMKAIEHNNPPDELQALQGAGYNPDVHGFNGPVNVSFPTPMRIPFAQSIYKAAIPLAFPGLEVTSDLSDRINSVSASTSWTIWHDPKDGINRRSSAAYALLYAEKQQRSTLTVLAEHRVAKIIWDAKDKNTPTAKGVYFGNPTKGSKLYAVYAKKEVILAAGALGSAPILERSGVGAASVLKKVGIKQVVDLPGVGSNLSDQPGTGASALVVGDLMSNTSLIDGRNLFAPVITLPNLVQLFGTNAATTLKWKMTTSIPARAKALVKAGAAVNIAGATSILTTATALVAAADMPVVEFVGESYPAVLTAVFWPLLPQSRGHIHIASSKPFQDPIIVPRLLSDEFDVKFAVQVARKSREVFTSAPMSAVVADAYADPAKVGPNATDAEYEAWLKETSFAASHWAGSTAMLPRSLGGVVDPNLKVYGTKKLRIVDVGILPLQLTSHTMSTAYAVALKASTLILQK